MTMSEYLKTREHILAVLELLQPNTKWWSLVDEVEKDNPKGHTIDEGSKVRLANTRHFTAWLYDGLAYGNWPNNNSKSKGASSNA